MITRDTAGVGRVLGRGLVVASLLASGACSSSRGRPDAPLVQGVVASVSATDNTFRPLDKTVANGTTVEWKNEGRTGHAIQPVDATDWGVEESQFGPDATYQHRFTKPGTYRYYCPLHGTAKNGMVGTVVVTG